MNQVPENDILVRNQIQMYNKKYPVNAMWLLEQNKCRIKKTLTGQRRNTIILKHLMFQSCDYPHFICLSFRQFECYIYIILWAPYRCLCIFTLNIHLLVSRWIPSVNSRWGVVSWNAGQVIFVFSLWDGDEMSDLYRKPSIVASYQVSVHLAKKF